MIKKKIYLDYNATSPLRPEAREAMLDILSLEDTALNASSVHSQGQKGRKIIEDARRQIANLTGTDAKQVIFNSGATEGNNTVLLHFSQNFPDETILISAAEHPSILESLTALTNTKTIPIDNNGILRLDALETLLQENKTSLVSCMMVNNETGVIQDVSKISDLTHKYGALFHCDGAQAAGRTPINLNKNGIDFLTLSSHKIGGPQGVGALTLRLCGQTPSLLFGGGQEKSARAGTENVAGIAGFGAAAQQTQESLKDYRNLSILRDKIENKITSLSSDVIVHSKSANRVANTSFFSLPNTNAQSILMALDLDGIAISNGSACSSGTVKPSATLKAMGCDKNIAGSALRISLGWATKDDDIDIFLEIWEKIILRQNKN